MTDYSTNFFGALIDTNEIADGAVTFQKLATSALNVLSTPIGSIVAWHKSLTGTPAIPSG